VKGVVGNVMLWGNVIIMGEKLWGGGNSGFKVVGLL